MKIAVLSDTHLRSGESLPSGLAAVLRPAEHILHAGDLTSLDCLRALQQIAPVTAVCGNMDGYPLTEILAPRECLELGGMRIGLCHGGGSPVDIESRLLTMFRDDGVELIVYGHTHIPVCHRRGGVRLLNPGSATDPLRSGRRSIAWLDTEGGGIAFSAW